MRVRMGPLTRMSGAEKCVDDFVADGPQPYTILAAPATSADASYSGFDAPDVRLTNLDNDVAGITVTPFSTHISASMPDAMVDAACDLFARTFAPALTLILGGADSEIRPTTTRIALECASFEPREPMRWIVCGCVCGIIHTTQHATTNVFPKFPAKFPAPGNLASHRPRIHQAEADSRLFPKFHIDKLWSGDFLITTVL